MAPDAGHDAAVYAGAPWCGVNLETVRGIVRINSTHRATRSTDGASTHFSHRSTDPDYRSSLVANLWDVAERRAFASAGKHRKVHAERPLRWRGTPLARRCVGRRGIDTQALRHNVNDTWEFPTARFCSAGSEHRQLRDGFSGAFRWRP